MASIAVVIPTLEQTGDPPPVAGLRTQTWPPTEIEIVRAVRPNGRARNVGIARTHSEILVLIDDDARIPQAELIEALVAPLLADAKLGATGAGRLIPPDSSAFQRWTAREVARIENPVVDAPLDTRPGPENGYYCAITTTCCALRRAVFDEVGGFSEALIQGVDTEFFVRLTRAGYRLQQVPHVWVYHPAPETMRALVRKHFRYGIGHAQEVLRDPARARGLERSPWLYLLARTAFLVPNVFFPFSYATPSWRPSFKPLKALISYVSALGYVWGRVVKA